MLHKRCNKLLRRRRRRWGSVIPQQYVEKVYAGILGMNAGIRLGAPVEPVEWTPQTIQDAFGVITKYVKDYTVFSADDDANGPIFFIRAITDYAKDRRLEPKDMEKVWLNFFREGKGMIWWGGDQISTEHRAYLNMKKGIKAPQSGSIAVNGELLAEQIGGQIFIDCFGWIFPNEPTKAADYAEIAASVSHDGNGLYGARFIAACIAAAFTEQPVRKIIATALDEIPPTSTYANVVKAVLDFHAKHPEDFRQCRQFLEDEWGYDKYGGICHIIPNAGVCILALLYGEGSTSRAIEIATMCGWDTDCNAGSVGSIMGVLNGLTSIEPHYRKPINDLIICSSISGYLNIVDIPTYAKKIALLGYQLVQEEAPEWLRWSYHKKDSYFDFLLPGSTHGFRTSLAFKTFLRHTTEHGYRRPGALEIVLDRLFGSDVAHIFHRTFYRREQFMDEKYDPNFAPIAYSGQHVSMKVKGEQTRGEAIVVSPYIRLTSTKKELLVGSTVVVTSEWQSIEFTIPDTSGDIIEEVGIKIQSPASDRTFRAFGKVYLDEFSITGMPRYTIDLTKQVIEFQSVSPFAHQRGDWGLQQHGMTMSSEEHCLSLTGHFYMEQSNIESLLTPLSGKQHGLLFRAQGAEQYYFAGFIDEQKVAIGVHDFGQKVLCTAPYKWNLGEAYRMKVYCHDKQISLTINDVEVIKTEDATYSAGMWGYYAFEGGNCTYHDIKVNM